MTQEEFEQLRARLMTEHAQAQQRSTELANYRDQVMERGQSASWITAECDQAAAHGEADGLLQAIAILTNHYTEDGH